MTKDYVGDNDLNNNNNMRYKGVDMMQNLCCHVEVLSRFSGSRG